MFKLQTLKSKLPVLDTHRVQKMQAGSWRISDQTEAQRGYGYKWQKARDQFLRGAPAVRHVPSAGQDRGCHGRWLHHPASRGSVAVLAAQQLAAPVRHQRWQESAEPGQAAAAHRFGQSGGVGSNWLGQAVPSGGGILDFLSGLFGGARERQSCPCRQVLRGE